MAFTTNSMSMYELDMYNRHQEAKLNHFRRDMLEMQNQINNLRSQLPMAKIYDAGLTSVLLGAPDEQKNTKKDIKSLIAYYYTKRI